MEKGSLPKATVHGERPDVRTTSKQSLSAKITVATALMWICLLASVGPFVYAIYRIMASNDPGGFLGMAIIFLLLTQGILLLFPLIGFMYALRWRRSLQDRLHGLKTEV